MSQISVSRSESGGSGERRVSAWSLVFLSALLLSPGAAAAMWHALREATVEAISIRVIQPRRTDPDDTLTAVTDHSDLDEQTPTPTPDPVPTLVGSAPVVSVVALGELSAARIVATEEAPRAERRALWSSSAGRAPPV